MSYRPQTMSYTQQQVMQMQEEILADAAGGRDIPKDRLLELLEAEAHGVFSEQHFQSEEQMYAHLVGGINLVTATELKEFMHRHDNEDNTDE